MLPLAKTSRLLRLFITENAVEDYQTLVNGYDITNSYTPGKTSVSVTKAWDDADNQDGKRESSVKVELLADGTPVVGSETTLSADNNWTYTWAGLDVKKSGVNIVYKRNLQFHHHVYLHK